ncbi:hypothetical protein CDL12_15543 [Handroanthus impetiginosus]|uniref:BED-type domain-containing protein n=1 Tax=Handroanthus impetiginosus TaxID=429701 RepID=A0A2G9H2U7_9LAMI|nr:hypothetical protein CDL12_15543 [Handroanthus impetiginosus]
MSSQSQNQNQRNPSWNYGILPNPKDTNKIICKYCNKETNWGVNRSKKHLVGGYKDVKKCPKCPEFVRDEMRAYMTRRQETRNKMDTIPHFDEMIEEENEFEEATMTRGKKPMSSHSSSFASNPASTASYST